LIARLAYALTLLSAVTLSRAASGPDVTLSDSRNDRVVLSNGLITATIKPSAAAITALKFRGIDMLTAGYYSMDGGDDFRTPRNCIYTIKTRTPDMVDIGMRRIWRNEPQAFDIEIHYVLRRGDSGLYTYALLDHPAKYPATTVGEWRMVWKLSDDTLEKIYVDELRHWQMQSSKDKFEVQPIKEIIKITSGIRAGEYDCKYDYAASYYDIGCWGHASDKNKVGAWIVLGGYDFFNDGPTKQDLNAASNINHIHFGMDHYNASVTTVAANQNWRKLYGPFLLYCNYNTRGADALWADAKAQVEKEKAAWPYAWLTGNPDYPLEKDRGQVSGRFVVNDPLKPKVSAANAWVGLANPVEGKGWQFDSMGYQFWVRAGADGKFVIPHIRPGTYTLYAFTTGAVGEYSKADITVAAGKTIDLGELIWDVPHKGKTIAWEIGVPDRTAGEFRHGMDPRKDYIWEHFDRDFPNPLVYTIGQSNPATDWNYAQTRYGMSEPPTPHTWKINFDLPSAPAGDATLTLAIASAQRARIRITINDAVKPLVELAPSVQNGNAMLRLSNHAKYCVEYVTIPAAQLHAGSNTIALVLTRAQPADAHVMYDYVNLELP
jgi:rhamnogalacturonan endolyase